MELYKAIEKMRLMSEKGECFSFSFMSYQYDRNISLGVEVVQRAKLTKRPKADKDRFSEYKLYYFDFDCMQNKQCWQPLLLELNGEPIEIS